ncbi:MAG: hypothetical protein Kow0026_25370 [Oricola sp.]
MRDLSVLFCTVAMFAGLAGSHCRAEEIELSDYRLVFSEEFGDLDVSAWGENGSRWIAHTPWNGDFGDARFADPEPGFPFRTRAGVLRIEARKNEDGTWESGLLAGVNRDWQGFTARRGYFEARMRLPDGDGVWPAFWLNSRAGIELDVMEYYGRDNTRFSAAWHHWGEEAEDGHESDLHWTSVQPGILSSQYNTFGVLVEDEYVTFYFNREPIWRLPVPWDATMDPQFFPLVNLALGSGWPIDKTPSPSYLYVDYIRIYEPS